jgi:SAM-dependent methyltransferase
VNERSRRVMERCGLRYVRTFHLAWDDPIEGTEHGEVEYELRRQDWATAGMAGTRSFEELVEEGASVPVEGWDFSWFEGRATEERPSWGYSGMLAERAARTSSILDVQTGGGETFSHVLERLPSLPAKLAATESWPPNVAVARSNLARFGAHVVEVADEGPLPFADASFELVASRHPVVTIWEEIARVLSPGGTYLSQQVGPGSNRELYEFLMGPQPASDARSPERAALYAQKAGLVVADLRREPLLTLFKDVGAVVYFLRLVPWTVPDFTVERYLDRLHALHDRIVREGPFQAHAQRFLIEATKPS